MVWFADRLKHILFEKVTGFLILIIGIFGLLKLFKVLSPEFLISTEYLAWITTAACLVFGAILLTNKTERY
jgi:lipopolysaccharide export LptBFGC system permease protein LptF